MDHGRCAWIGPADAAWTSALSLLRHDFYHLPEYVALEASQGGGEPAAFLWHNGGRPFLVPLVIRTLPSSLDAPVTWGDAISPYGYSCPLAPSDATVEELTAFLQAFAAACAERDLITAFIRLHPLLPLPEAALSAVGTLVHHGPTVYMDLADEPWTRKSIRQEIQKLENDGFTTHLEAWEDYGPFIALYRQTMERVKASTNYFFSDHYFVELRRVLADRIHLCTVRAPSGEVAAGGLFPSTGDLIQYHLSGSNNRYLANAPSKLLLPAMRLWAMGHGFRYLHVGGGLGSATDSLFQFKSGYSRRTASFHSLRIVFHHEHYQTLLRKAGHSSADMTARFPAYRDPAASVAKTLPDAAVSAAQ